MRAIFDDAGKPMKEVTPGLAARVIGLSQLPPVASRFKVVDSEKTAREFCETNLARPEAGTVSTPITLEEFYQRLQAEGAKDLNIILKADVAGSMEAIAESLQRLNTEELKVRILHSGIGPVGEADVLLAKTSGSIVLAFNVNIDPKARETVRQENVQVRQYRIIYDLLDDVRKSLSGLLEPELKEVVTGRVQIKQIFKLSSGQLAIGCSVLEGKVNRGGKARLMRGDKAVAEVIVASLRRFKENVREVTAGYECGLTLDGADEALPGDQLVIYRIEEITRSL
ncbi:MAG: Translation initiation factor IF-2 [candidate division TA06 bacterium ADurb.Bin417]|uniref:Translation initiation factor IF-2 n=1 Tax=candidate division TA06 bacterium ADurb.Bin417 TaxID=1852828 RepID=A0A1V5M8L7_UNCT6|nr:MAG: Translation initiation factor IF-2 [candidate division TA06 bacterium ADurb.Bin417]